MANVFPASAGMIPELPPTEQAIRGVPRIRGDDPNPVRGFISHYMCSPHPRG